MKLILINFIVLKYLFHRRHSPGRHGDGNSPLVNEEEAVCVSVYSITNNFLCASEK